MCGSAAERRGLLSRATRNCRGALLYMCVCVAWWLAEMHVRRHNNPIVRARAGAGDGASTSGLARYNRANKKSARKYPNVCVCVLCARVQVRCVRAHHQPTWPTEWGAANVNILNCAECRTT